MKLKERNMAYDVIRTVALMMIIMVHVSAYMVIFFPDTANVEWAVGNFFNGIARAGVPMFIMLSGALLLREDKPFDTKKFYKKSLLTMALLTIGWMVAYGLFYSVLLPLLEGNAVVMSDFSMFLLTFKGSNYPHLWYMLMVVGMYLMIPVLRLFVKRENKPYILGIIIVSLIFRFGASTLDFFTVNCDVAVSDVLGKFHLQPATGFLWLILLGWYLNEYPLKKRNTFILCAVGLLSACFRRL